MPACTAISPSPSVSARAWQITIQRPSRATASTTIAWAVPTVSPVAAGAAGVATVVVPRGTLVGAVGGAVVPLLQATSPIATTAVRSIMDG